MTLLRTAEVTEVRGGIHLHYEKLKFDQIK
jgi:hypothetical protein